MKKEKSQEYWADLKNKDLELFHNYQLRFELVKTIVSEINKQGLKQSETALLFGIPQSRISRLYNGYIEDFRLDRLVNFAFRMNIPVNFDLN